MITRILILTPFVVVYGSLSVGLVHCTVSALRAGGQERQKVLQVIRSVGAFVLILAAIAWISHHIY